MESCGDARLSDFAPPADTASQALAVPTAVSTTGPSREWPARPICAPAVCRETVGGPNRIPMAAFTKHLCPPMLIDSIVTRQINKALGAKPFHNLRGQNSSDTPMPELCSRKEAVIRRPVSRHKTARRSQNVGDSASSDGQDRRCQQHTDVHAWVS